MSRSGSRKLRAAGATCDPELLEAFQNCTIKKRHWNHEAHVRVAYLHLRRYRFADAVKKLGAGIRKLNSVHGVIDGLTTGYHETLTCAFMSAIWATMQSAGPGKSSSDFWGANPHLWARTLPRLYYTRKRLMTWDAKARFVAPDLAPLPGPRAGRPTPKRRLSRRS